MVSSSQRLPATTHLGHTDRALSFVESNSVYFALGRTSPWPGGENEKGFVPPEVNLDADNLDELVCMKRATQKLMVVPDKTGEIEYDGQNWKVVDNATAITRKSRWVYITTTIRYNELELSQYRQVGIYNRVVPNDGVTKDLLLPINIKDRGLLIACNNRGVVTRQTDTRDVYSMIIEF